MSALSQEVLREFQAAYKKDFGVELPLEEIEIMVHDFTELLKILLKPVPEEKYLLSLRKYRNA